MEFPFISKPVKRTKQSIEVSFPNPASNVRVIQCNLISLKNRKPGNKWSFSMMPRANAGMKKVVK